MASTCEISPDIQASLWKHLTACAHSESVTIIRGVPGWTSAQAVVRMRTSAEAQLAMEDFQMIREGAGEGIRERMVTVEWAWERS